MKIVAVFSLRLFPGTSVRLHKKNFSLEKVYLSRIGAHLDSPGYKMSYFTLIIVLRFTFKLVA
jgi:hypothetical protein